MNNVNISIIIPHFNSVDSLDKLIQSIGRYPDVETIIVDDKSDKYLQDLAICKQKYISNTCLFLTNITSKKGAGVSRNIGLQKARGKWLLFADADDVFVKNWYLIVKKYLYTSADIVYFPPIGREPYKLLVEAYLQNKPGAEKHIRYQFFPPWSKLIKRSLVEEKEINFDETKYSNDVLFSTKCGFYAKTVIANEEAIYNVIGRDGSLTKQKNFDALYIRSEVICRTYQFLHSHLSPESFKLCYIQNTPLADIWNLIKGRYSFKQICKIYRLYRSYDIPVIVRSNFKKIISYFYRHL